MAVPASRGRDPGRRTFPVLRRPASGFLRPAALSAVGGMRIRRSPPGTRDGEHDDLSVLDSVSRVPYKPDRLKGRRVFDGLAFMAPR
jgi:hypothetical protein